MPKDYYRGKVGQPLHQKLAQRCEQIQELAYFTQFTQYIILQHFKASRKY